MIEGKRIFALITARGGSKGIPNKNIKPLAGKPLIQWTIDAATNSRYIDRLILSSDSANIISVAKQAGCEVPFIRPKDLAKDDTGSMEVVLHALDKIEEEFDYLLLLQPTSPFRTAEHIDKILEFTTRMNADLVVSVAKLKNHPMFMYEINDGQLKSFFPSTRQLRRQDMPPAYEHNGALYVARPDCLYKNKSFNSPDALAYVTTGNINIDIDRYEDWEIAECLINKGVQ